MKKALLGKTTFLTFLSLIVFNLPGRSVTLDAIAFGNTTSETAHGLVSKSTSVITGALSQSARQCLPLSPVGIHGGDLTFTIKVDPEKRNYVTVKFWGGDESIHAKRADSHGAIFWLPVEIMVAFINEEPLQINSVGQTLRFIKRIKLCWH